MDKYRFVDGVLYKAVDTAEVKTKIAVAVREVRPYQQAQRDLDVKIESLKKQRAEYDAQVEKIIAQAGLDADLVRQLDPESATLLGF